jgi:hypothetical protein
MNDETTIKPEFKEEVVRIFRKLIASGVLDSDKAITKILRDFPNYFHQPTADDIAKISRDELNAEIRQRALQPNKRSIDIFRRPTDENPR